jgi:hypothetical protein
MNSINLPLIYTLCVFRIRFFTLDDDDDKKKEEEDIFILDKIGISDITQFYFWKKKIIIQNPPCGFPFKI